MFSSQVMSMAYSVISDFNSMIAGLILIIFETFSNSEGCIRRQRILFEAKSAHQKVTEFKKRTNTNISNFVAVTLFV